MTVSAAKGQDPAPKKLGVVFSGGSEKSWAFVRVLEELEAHRVPVSAIGGTSGGALVGAMYHQGASPAEMRKLLRYLSTDQKVTPWVESGNDDDPGQPSEIRKMESWVRLLGNHPSYDNLVLRQKNQRRHYEIPLETGPNGISSLSYGPRIALVLSRIALGHRRGESFVKNGVPFACVTTNLASRPVSTILHREGSLVVGLRGSMAIPFLFASIPATSADVPNLYSDLPRGKDLALLTDGGATDVFPVKRVMEGKKEGWMVLGATVQPLALDRKGPGDGFNAGKASSLERVGDSLLKMIGMGQTLPNEEYAQHNGALLPITDGAGWWHEPELAYEATERALKARRAEVDRVLDACRVPEEEWLRYQGGRDQVRAYRAFRPTDIRARIVSASGDVENARSGNAADRLQRRFSDFANQLFDVRDLAEPQGAVAPMEQRIEQVCGEDRFMYATYERDGDALLLTFYEQGVGKPITRFGWNFLSYSGNKSLNTLEAQVSLFDVVGPDSVTKASLAVGDLFDLRVTADRPIGAGGNPKLSVRADAGYQLSGWDRWSFEEPAVRVSRFNDSVFEGGSALPITLIALWSSTGVSVTSICAGPVRSPIPGRSRGTRIPGRRR
jgi:predicted acylesterase/phospholipase RssA